MDPSSTVRRSKDGRTVHLSTTGFLFGDQSKIERVGTGTTGVRVLLGLSGEKSRQRSVPERTEVPDLLRSSVDVVAGSVHPFPVTVRCRKKFHAGSLVIR